MAAVPQHFPVKLTQARHKVMAETAAELADRRANQRTLPVALAELKAINGKAGRAMRQAGTGMVRNPLRHVTDLSAQALDRSRGLGAIPAADRHAAERHPGGAGRRFRTSVSPPWRVLEFSGPENSGTKREDFPAGRRSRGAGTRPGRPSASTRRLGNGAERCPSTTRGPGRGSAPWRSGRTPTRRRTASGSSEQLSRTFPEKGRRERCRHGGGPGLATPSAPVPGVGRAVR
jgi:hypothetical protein